MTGRHFPHALLIGSGSTTFLRPRFLSVLVTFPLLAGLVATSPVVMAGDPRDVVFECPCSAVWVADRVGGDQGELTLSFGLRNHRSTDSGEIRLRAIPRGSQARGVDDLAVQVDRVSAGRATVSQRRTMDLTLDEPGAPIGVMLYEKIGDGAMNTDAHWLVERLTLWPVPDDRGTERIEYVDILTDSDSDGVGDVNERIVGTDPGDPSSKPGVSTIDVLALYNDGFHERFRRYPQTRIHHVMALTKAIFADSGTDIRLRTVGIVEVELDDRGNPINEELELERHGADVTLRFHAGSTWSCGGGGCSGLGGAARGRGYWQADSGPAIHANVGAAHAAHEMGHNFGLVHSERQGEAFGAFRWSRGHYVDHWNGTVMTYGARQVFQSFSDADATCVLGSCGVPTDAPDGADAVASLDILRFQVAANRNAEPDSDGDGIVDPVDALPQDSSEWLDRDGDGVGENADVDDDNDGVDDTEDAFPLDAAEWADVDGDGIGDNADEDVVDLGPFRDAALRDAVAETLGWASDLPASEYDLSGLLTLEAVSRGIRDLTGLELASNLDILDVSFNDIVDLSPLAGLDALDSLNIGFNQVTDLEPLEGLAGLGRLNLGHNPITTTAPLSSLRGLRYLWMQDIPIPDLSVLVGLNELRYLTIWFGGITDVSPLASLPRLSTVKLPGNKIVDPSSLSNLALYSLMLSENPVADLGLIAGLSRLDALFLENTSINDLSPISGLNLTSFAISYNELAFEDIVALPFFRQLRALDAQGLDIDDISPIAELEHDVWRLGLSDNRIADLSPLSGVCCLRNLHLTNNLVSDIGPLIKRDIWGGENSEGAVLLLWDNPLDHPSFEDDVAVLESWGVKVISNSNHGRAAPTWVSIPDATLRELIVQEVASAFLGKDDPLTESTMARLHTLRAFNAGIKDLEGLGAARNLWTLYAGSNAISNLGPLSDLEDLDGLDLSNNVIFDIAPLADSLGGGDWVTLTGNPLTEASLNTHVPALRSAGVAVEVGTVDWLVVVGDGPATFDTDGYFESLLGPGSQIEASAPDSDLAAVSVAGSVLQVAPGAKEGSLAVTVTATNGTGETASLVFAVTVAHPEPVPLFPAASDPARQGFVRVINRSDEAVEVRIDATDGDGRRAVPLRLPLARGAAVHINSNDVENGNPGKRLLGRTGSGTGDWRLSIASGLNTEVLSYIRTDDGFLTSMHDAAPVEDGAHRIPIFNPGSNASQVSLLRLVNPDSEYAAVSITGVDDAGNSPGAPVALEIRPGTALTLSASELETGAGLDGALGDGKGKWRLAVESDRPLIVMSLLSSRTGHLTNLSTVPPEPGQDGVHTVPLFPSASDPLGRQGFLRVVNRSATAGTVTVTAFDDGETVYETLTIALRAGETAHINSNDLELGNAAMGLEGGTGPGAGDWRLALTSALDIEVLSYIRTEDGFLTSMHDVVPFLDGVYRVAMFNPASNRNQMSGLLLVNTGTEDALVAINGIDDSGASPGEAVGLSVPAGGSRTVWAAALELGGEGLRGFIGDGVGKWRLSVESDRPIVVINLLSSPTGHLTNLSTAPSGGYPASP